MLTVLIRPLTVVTEFLDALNDSLAAIKPSARLTATQKTVLATMIVGILMTDILNWVAFERRSLGTFKATRLC